MNSTTKLFEMGQSIWLDSITRDMLTNGTLAQYIKDFSVTGLTSNPTIFDHAIKNTNEYDQDIRKKSEEGLKGEPLFVELEMDDLRRAADLFRPIHDQTSGVDGWVSLELSPLLRTDPASARWKFQSLNMGCNSLIYFKASSSVHILISFLILPQLTIICAFFFVFLYMFCIFYIIYFHFLCGLQYFLLSIHVHVDNGFLTYCD